MLHAHPSPHGAADRRNNLIRPVSTAGWEAEGWTQIFSHSGENTQTPQVLQATYLTRCPTLTHPQLMLSPSLSRFPSLGVFLLSDIAATMHHTTHSRRAPERSEPDMNLSTLKEIRVNNNCCKIQIIYEYSHSMYLQSIDFFNPLFFSAFSTVFSWSALFRSSACRQQQQQHQQQQQVGQQQQQVARQIVYALRSWLLASGVTLSELHRRWRQ